jgi:predicted metal-binding membrane protein
MEDVTAASFDRDVARTWAVLAVLGAIGWVVTVAMARDMGVGPGTMNTAFVLFLAAWVAMMGAMMLPAVGPTAARDLALAPSVTPLSRLASVGPFALGFLAPWAVYGAVLFVALVGTGDLVDSSPGAASWLGVAILAIAGLYQLSAAKRKALLRCRGINTPHAGANAMTRFRAGAAEGTVCVGCCWALMTVLIAFGVMNLAAMVGLAAVIFAEKVLRRPIPVARAAGVVLLALAVLAAFHHPLLSGLTPMSSPMSSMMG